MRKIAWCCALALLVAPVAGADHGEKEAKAAADPGMPMPTPGPEHEMLKDDVGTWDAKVEMWMDPSQPPMVSTGTETNTMGPGGFWLLSDFKGDMGGTPFEGHGVTGWDPAKKKYVGTWIDSMSPSLGMGESTWDPATKTVTGTFESMGPDGKMAKMKSVVKYNDDGTRVFTMSMPGPDGKDMTTMRITYTRRK